MANEAWSKFSVGALQLAATVALTGLGLYLLLAGRLSARSLSMMILTSGIFGLAAYQTRDKWQDRRYWVTLLGCLAIHVALVTAIRVYLAPAPLAILGFFGAFECAALVWLLLTVCE